MSVIYSWERHILKRLSLRFILLTIAIFLLIMGLDFSLRAAATGSILQQIYLSTLRTTLHSGLIVSIALLLAAHSMLFSLMGQGEWLTLLVSGISVRRIARPFIWLAISASLMIAASLQWLSPMARQTTHATNSWCSARVNDSQIVVCKRQGNNYTKVWWLGPDLIAYADKIADNSALDPKFALSFKCSDQRWCLLSNTEVKWPELTSLKSWDNGDSWQSSSITTCLKSCGSSDLAALYGLYALAKISMPLLALLILLPSWGRYRRAQPQLRYLLLALSWIIGSLILFDMTVALGALQLVPAQQCISTILLLYCGTAIYRWLGWQPEQRPPYALKALFKIATQWAHYAKRIQQHGNTQATH